MKPRLTIVFFVVAALWIFTNESASGQGLFRVTFRASGKALNQFNQENDLRITEGNIIAAAVTANGLSSRAARNYVLVYNSTNDALQVVRNSDGRVLTDVIQFEGGGATTDQRQATRFTFMFLPDATTAFGSIFITENWPGIMIGDDNDRAKLTGRMQFALTGNEVLGSNSLISVTNTNTITITNIVTITNSPGSTNTSSGDTNGLALNDSGNNTNGGGSGTSLNPITETNSLALTSPATPPQTANSNGSTNTSSVGTVMPSALSTTTVNAAAIGAPRLNAVAVGSSPNMFISTGSLGGTNATNVRVYTGTFTAGRRFLPNGANSPIAGPPPVSTADTNTALSTGAGIQ
jgi:hypothetical protein